MPQPRPEFAVCRVCGYDISQRTEEYLICPECGAANNRLMAAREAGAHRHSNALRITLGALAALLAMFFMLCSGALLPFWIWAPMSMLISSGAAFAAMTLYTPRAQRRQRFRSLLVMSGICGGGAWIVISACILFVMLLARLRF